MKTTVLKHLNDLMYEIRTDFMEPISKTYKRITRMVSMCEVDSHGGPRLLDEYIADNGKRARENIDAAMVAALQPIPIENTVDDLAVPVANLNEVQKQMFGGGGGMANYYGEPYYVTATATTNDVYGSTAGGYYQATLANGPLCTPDGGTGGYAYGTQGVWANVDYGVSNAKWPQDLSMSSEIRVKVDLGKGRSVYIQKKLESGELSITMEDLESARMEFIRQKKVVIIAGRADRRAEDLLRQFVSDVDFRNYKEKGYFEVTAGNKLYRIHKDYHKKVDMFERKGSLFMPSARLCVHTPSRELPHADEALVKLMLIRSGKITDRANIFKDDVCDLVPVEVANG